MWKYSKYSKLLVLDIYILLLDFVFGAHVSHQSVSVGYDVHVSSRLSKLWSVDLVLFQTMTTNQPIISRLTSMLVPAVSRYTQVDIDI